MRFLQICICIAAMTGAGLAQTTVTTSGTTSSGTVPVFNGTATVTNSPIAVSGSNVGIGTAAPVFKLQINGSPSAFGTSDYVEGSSGSALVIQQGTSTGNTYSGIGAYSGGGTAVNNLVFQWAGGNVGIGTTSPNATLHVYGNSSISQIFLGQTAGADLTSIIKYTQGNGSGTGRLWLGHWGDNDANGVGLNIVKGGNVGIGTTAPGSALEVNGNVKLTSGSGASITFADGTSQSTAWTGVLCGGDYAESVGITGKRQQYEPGDLIVVDPANPGHFEKSSLPYSTLVAGIYSTKPGAIGKRSPASSVAPEIPMAMIGIVPAKVSAENGPIKPGDLLVTSSTVGYAMKGADHDRMTGTVVGKALGSVPSDKGVIEALVTLQ